MAVLGSSVAKVAGGEWALGKGGKHWPRIRLPDGAEEDVLVELVNAWGSPGTLTEQYGGLLNRVRI